MEYVPVFVYSVKTLFSEINFAALWLALKYGLITRPFLIRRRSVAKQKPITASH